MQELKNKKAAVVVFSGGQDSTTCLFWAIKRYETVIALSFDYHQKHALELECAKKICREHGIEHYIMDMSLLNQLAPNSLTRSDIPVDEEAPSEGTPNSFVDGRTGEHFIGTITGIRPGGDLEVRIATTGQLRTFLFKEIEYVI